MKSSSLITYSHKSNIPKITSAGFQDDWDSDFSRNREAFNHALRASPQLLASCHFQHKPRPVAPEEKGAGGLEKFDNSRDLRASAVLRTYSLSQSWDVGP